MRYRQLSPTGDYVFGQGLKNFYIDVPAAVAQAVETGLTLWLGEWFLDNTVGMPWPESVLGKHSQSTADTAVRDQVLNTQGVTDISAFNSTIDPVTRAYSVTMTIDTAFGPTTIELQNLTNF